MCTIELQTQKNADAIAPAQLDLQQCTVRCLVRLISFIRFTLNSGQRGLAASNILALRYSYVKGNQP